VLYACYIGYILLTELPTLKYKFIRDIRINTKLVQSTENETMLSWVSRAIILVLDNFSLEKHASLLLGKPLIAGRSSMLAVNTAFSQN
jgi:hypothetical protein